MFRPNQCTMALKEGKQSNKVLKVQAGDLTSQTSSLEQTALIKCGPVTAVLIPWLVLFFFFFFYSLICCHSSGEARHIGPRVHTSQSPPNYHKVKRTDNKTETDRLTLDAEPEKGSAAGEVMGSICVWVPHLDPRICPFHLFLWFLNSIPARTHTHTHTHKDTHTH